MVAQSVAIRTCEERDLDHFGAFGAPSHVDYCREQFGRGREAVTILVAVDDDDLPMGKLHLDFVTRAAHREAVLVAAAVKRELQSRGIGTALMGAAEELVCSRGFGGIVLGVGLLVEVVPCDRPLPLRQPELDELSAAVLLRLAVEGERVGGRVEVARGELVQRPRVADLVLGDGREGDVLLEERRDPGPFRVAPAEDQLVVSDRD